MPINLDDAERIKQVLIDPTVAALKRELESQLAPLVIAKQDHEDRLANLESTNRKALVGFGLASLGISAIMTGVWEWAKSKVHLG